MRYCLYAYPAWLIQSYGLNPSLAAPISSSKLPYVMHSGLTNWARVFDGVYDAPTSVDSYGDYDVVHVNMTTNNIGLIKRIKSHLEYCHSEKKPMIVVNPDYAVNMWGNFGRFDLFLKDINLADRIFCVHPVMSSSLESFLDRKVWTIPHPTNTEMLQQFRGKREVDPFPKQSVLVLIHPYDQNYLLPTYVLMKLREKMDFAIVMIGRMEKDTPFIRSTYDEVYDSVEFSALVEIMSRVDVMIDTSVLHTYGRSVVECATIGTQCIGGRNIDAMHRLYHTRNVIDPYDAQSMMDNVKLGLEGKLPPIAESSYYSYGNCRKMFEEMVDASE